MSTAKEWFLREPGPNRFRVSGETVRATEESMAASMRGACPFCKASVPEGEQCPCWNKENE